MTHWPTYIEYTGWYNYCQRDDMTAKEVSPERPDPYKVNCPVCRDYLDLD